MNWIAQMPHDPLLVSIIRRIFQLSSLVLAMTSCPVFAQEAGKSALFALQDAFTSVAEEVEPAVVTITARKAMPAAAGSTAQERDYEIPRGFPFRGGDRQRGFRAHGTGSGVLITTDGWILTNDHVTGGSSKVTVRLLDGREFEGTVRRDYRSDLALVKIEGTSFRAARLGNSDDLKIGQWAIAIGSPFRYEGTFSVGVISSLFRRQEIRASSGAPRIYPSMIQTDAAINPGNSGGPLLNLDGEVVGINTAIESDSGGSVGIGFAIPINAARYVADQLRSKGKVTYGYLGIEPTSITPRLVSAYRVPSGALVQGDPAEESPAAKAGLQADDVITEIDGKAIRGELDLRNIVSRLNPGAVVSLTYFRSGVEVKVKATIAEAPSVLGDESLLRPGPERANLGLEVASSSAEGLKKLGLDSKFYGVTVRSVESGGAVAESEIEKGDIILKINDHLTPNVSEFKRAEDALKAGDIVRVLWAGRRGRTTVRRVAVIVLD